MQTGVSGWGRNYYAWARMPLEERLLVPVRRFRLQHPVSRLFCAARFGYDER